MKALLIQKEDNIIIDIVDNVLDVGVDYITGDNKSLIGIDTQLAEIIVIENSEIGDLIVGSIISEGINDKKHLFKKSTVEELEQELSTLKKMSLNADEFYKSLDINDATLEELKNYKIAQIGYLTTKAISDGFFSETVGKTFGFNLEHDQSNFTQQLLLIVVADGNYTAPIHWKTIEGDLITMTVEEFMSVVNEATQHKISNQNRYWQLEAQVLACETNEEIDQINW